jgi:hypothetical protein
MRGHEPGQARCAQRQTVEAYWLEVGAQKPSELRFENREPVLRVGKGRLQHQQPVPDGERCWSAVEMLSHLAGRKRQGRQRSDRTGAVLREDERGAEGGRRHGGDSPSEGAARLQTATQRAGGVHQPRLLSWAPPTNDENDAEQCGREHPQGEQQVVMSVMRRMTGDGGLRVVARPHHGPAIVRLRPEVLEVRPPGSQRMGKDVQQVFEEGCGRVLESRLIHPPVGCRLGGWDCHRRGRPARGAIRCRGMAAQHA